MTNGYMTPEALALIAPVLDAASIDLKSFRPETGCGADTAVQEYYKQAIFQLLESFKMSP